MDSITEVEMSSCMNKLGGLGIIHRFMKIKDHISQLIELGTGPVVVCIGVGTEELRRLEEALKIGVDAVLIDIAHGHSTAMIEQIKEVKKLCNLPIIAGNIGTERAAVDLINAGADCLKVGIGPGTVCRTRHNTGVGVPQLTAIKNVASIIDQVNRPVSLIADGGIRYPGDIIKALAVGADAVMVGSIFSGTDETPGQIMRTNGSLFKTYRGLASREAQLSWKGEATSIEGESITVPYKGSVETIFRDTINNILSGFSYLNARNIRELQENATFIRRNR